MFPKSTHKRFSSLFWQTKIWDALLCGSIHTLARVLGGRVLATGASVGGQALRYLFGQAHSPEKQKVIVRYLTLSSSSPQRKSRKLTKTDVILRLAPFLLQIALTWFRQLAARSSQIRVRCPVSANNLMHEGTWHGPRLDRHSHLTTFPKRRPRHRCDNRYSAASPISSGRRLGRVRSNLCSCRRHCRGTRRIQRLRCLLRRLRRTKSPFRRTRTSCSRFAQHR